MVREVVHSIWFILAAWGLVYLSDYYLTIYAARLMLGALRDHICFQGSLELTPVFQKDVDALRLLSPAFLVRWLISLSLLLVLWWATGEIGAGWVFTALIGGLFLREAVVHLRHLRNIALAHLSKAPGSLQGHVEYSRSLSLKQSGTELLSFAAFYMALSVALGSWFFLGGAAFCALTGGRHWRYAVRPRSAERSRAAQAVALSMGVGVVALGGLLACTGLASDTWFLGPSIYLLLLYLLYPLTALVLGIAWGLLRAKPWVAVPAGLLVFVATMVIWRGVSLVLYVLVYTLICVAGYAAGRAARWAWRRLAARR